MTGLVRRVIALGGLSLGTRVLTSLAAFITIPVILAGLGPEVLGLYFATTGLLAFLSFADSGLGAGVRTVAAKQTGNRQEGLSEVFSNGTAMLAAVALTAAFVLTPFIVLVNWADLLDATSLLEGRDVTVAVAVLVTIYLVGLPLLASQRVLEGTGRTHFVIALSIVPSAVLLLGSAVALVLGGGICFVRVCVLSQRPRSGHSGMVRM